MKPKFKIGDKVVSVLNRDFTGQVITVVQHQFGYVYVVTHFKDNEPMSANMYDFELEPAPANGALGFRKE